MKHPDTSNVSPGMEPLPTAVSDVDASPVRMLRGDHDVETFVVSAYQAHHAAVFAFLARATRDRFVAEDLLQETYLRLTKEAREGRAPLHVRGWLYRVASNLVIERSRRQTTALRWLGRHARDDYARMIAPSPEVGVLTREWAAEMGQILAGLRADARLAMLLSSEGFDGEEIASAIGRTAAATRTLLCRARAQVRERHAHAAEVAR